MKRNFKVSEILESVDSIVSDNNYTAYDNKKIIDRYKKFLEKNIDMAKNPDNEKIIFDAEKSLIDKKSDTITNDPINQKNENVLVLKNEIKNERIGEENNSKNILVLKDEFIDQSNIKENNSLGENYKEILFLEDELIDEKENSLKKLEDNYIYINKKFKYLNTKQEEKIKDLNILLEKFTSKERYINLDKKIKLYQEDNAALRNKILNLSDNESKLRLNLSNLYLEKNTNSNESDGTDQEEIKKLNTQIENLLQKNNELKTEILILRKNKPRESTDVNQKINFYREEHAKIILDKSDIERKLENTKNQLSANENNKQKLKLALDNLNKILAESNIESSTFINKIEFDKIEPSEDKKEKNYEKRKSKPNEGGLGFLLNDYLEQLLKNHKAK